MLIAESYPGTFTTDPARRRTSFGEAEGNPLYTPCAGGQILSSEPLLRTGAFHTEDKSMDNLLFTFTGIPAAEIPARLAEPFDDPRAYKGVPGGADLTDINTGHMIERITQVFGPKGLGWNFLFNKDDVEIASSSEKRVLVRLKYAVFQYTLFNAEGQPQIFEIVTSGANANSIEYAEEGARTSALGAAVKGLCFQLPVYKGQLDHHNVEKYLAGGNGKGNGKVRSSDAKSDPAPAGAGESEPASQPSAFSGNGGSEDPGDYVINVGTKYRGKKVCELAENVLAWFANLDGKGFAPQSSGGQTAQEAARRYLDLQAEPA